MGYQVLARKYRPQRFADVAGQDHVTVTLMNALVQDRIAHGYIFSGHRGIGKTTIARILACALNCRNAIGSAARPTAEPCEVCESCLEIRAGNSVDVIEIDAATNRGIDEIRELRDAARYRPSRDRYKIYILDEAHQITDAAFNALLKTLEEPPDHIVFMMATTQPEDIPQTVRSRCQHFSFHAVKLLDILGELRGIAEHEGVDADEGALGLLAEAGDGSMRDALSIMDQAIASAPVFNGKARLDAAQIRELMGTVANGVFERILQAVDENRSAEVMTITNELLNAGNSPAQLARQAVRFLRGCLIAKIAGLTAAGGDSTELLQISPEEQRRAARTASLFTEEELTRFLQVMLRTFDEMGYRQEQRFHLELGLLKLVHLRRLLPVEEVLSAMSGARPAGLGPGPVKAPNVATTARLPVVPVTPTAVKPAFSPFEQDKNRRRYDGVQGSTSGANALMAEASEARVQAASPVASLQPVVLAPPVVLIPPVVAAPVPAISTPLAAVKPDSTPFPVATPIVVNAPIAPPNPVNLPEAGISPEPQAAHTRLQSEVVSALRAASQGSAADAVEDATWDVADGEAKVQTQLSKIMLPVHINADAEKIIKAKLLQEGVRKLTLRPGVAVAGSTKKARTQAIASNGSAQAKAEGHPLVQQARKIFEAEIQTVFDLSGKE